MKEIILTLSILLNDTDKVCVNTEAVISISTNKFSLSFDGVEYSLEAEKRIGKETNDTFFDSFVSGRDNKWLMKDNKTTYYLNGGITDSGLIVFISDQNGGSMTISNGNLCQ